MRSFSVNALCSYPLVKMEIRDSIQILTTAQCPARVDIESSRSESEKNSLSLFVREVKSEMKI